MCEGGYFVNSQFNIVTALQTQQTTIYYDMYYDTRFNYLDTYKRQHANNTHSCVFYSS